MSIIWVMLFCILVYAVVNTILYCFYVNIHKRGIGNDNPMKYMMIFVFFFGGLWWFITSFSSMIWFRKALLFISRHPGYIHKDKWFKSSKGEIYKVTGHGCFDIDSSILVTCLKDKRRVRFNLFDWSNAGMVEIPKEQVDWEEIK